MSRPDDIERGAPKRLEARLPLTEELEAAKRFASVRSEAARIAMGILEVKMRTWNGEIVDIIGEPVKIHATEVFTKFKDQEDGKGAWVYKAADRTTPIERLNPEGLLEGLEVMDTLVVGLPMPTDSEEERDRLVLCLAIAPEVAMADWEHKLIPVESIISIY